MECEQLNVEERQKFIMQRSGSSKCSNRCSLGGAANDGQQRREQAAAAAAATTAEERSRSEEGEPLPLVVQMTAEQLLAWAEEHTAGIDIGMIRSIHRGQDTTGPLLYIKCWLESAQAARSAVELLKEAGGQAERSLLHTAQHQHILRLLGEPWCASE